MNKIYISDFITQLNYNNIVLYIENVNYEDLRNKLTESCINHIYRLDEAIENKSYIIYIENCDVQNLDDDSYTIYDLLEEGYNILQLQQDDIGFYYNIQ